MSVKNALDSFGFDVVEGAKRELNRKKKNTSKKLSNSLDYKLKVSKNSFTLSFFMEDYGTFIDQGVKGIGGKKADGEVYKKKRFSSKITLGKKQFKYKKGIKNKPSRKHFDKWVVKRGISGRNSKGQFTTRIGLTTAISHSVWHTGLESTHFFSKPFAKEFKNLPDELVEAYGLQVDDFLNFTINKK